MKNENRTSTRTGILLYQNKEIFDCVETGAVVPTTNYAFETCIEFELTVGESPVWDDQYGTLWFVDVLKPAIYSLDPESGQTTAYSMPSEVGSIGLVDDGGLVVALRHGVHLFDPRTRRLEFLVHPEPEKSTINRLNDGKVGPDGCFWVGSMHDSQPRQPTASLYRVTMKGQVTRVLDGLKVSNGLAWSPDGQTMYHSDSRGPFVRAFDFEPANGRLSNERTLVVLDEATGLPDGAAVDAEGCYWSAGVSAGVLNRFSADGILLERVELPAAAPTMPCFGGRDLKTMFITSLTADRDGLLTRGTLIACRVDVPGIASNRMSKARSLRSSAF